MRQVEHCCARDASGERDEKQKILIFKQFPIESDTRDSSAWQCMQRATRSRLLGFEEERNQMKILLIKFGENEFSHEC